MTTEPTYLTSDPGMDRLYDNVQATVPGAAIELIKMEAWNTVEEFCLRSTFYRASAAWQMAPGVRTFDFNPYDGGMVAFAILKVLGLANYTAQPPAILCDAGSIMTSSRQGVALLALKPVSFDCGLPPDLSSRWFECMMDGVKGRMAAQQSKPYSNATAAEYHLKRFRVGVNLARAEAQQLYSGQTNFRYPYFACGVRKS